MQSEYSEHHTDSFSNSFSSHAHGSMRPTGHRNYMLIMREGKASGVIPALEPPKIPTELRAAATRASVRRWAARRIGWLS